MKFRDYLTITEAVVDAPHGIFAKVLPTTETVKTLTEVFSMLPIVDDLHATLMFSKTPARSVDLPDIDKHTRYMARALELLHWPGHDKEGYIVLALASDALQEAHKLFRNAGLEPTFPDYKPHVTMVHPVPNFESHKASFDHYNALLKEKPMNLEFYYGGYVLMEPES